MLFRSGEAPEPTATSAASTALELPPGLELDADGLYIIHQTLLLSENWGRIAKDVPCPPHFPAQWKRCKCHCEDMDLEYALKKIRLLA